MWRGTCELFVLVCVIIFLGFLFGLLSVAFIVHMLVLLLLLLLLQLSIVVFHHVLCCYFGVCCFCAFFVVVVVINSMQIGKECKCFTCVYMFVCSFLS